MDGLGGGKIFDYEYPTASVGAYVLARADFIGVSLRSAKPKVSITLCPLS